MKYKYNISEKKVKALKEKMKVLKIASDDIEESFSLGSGKGGQKINKTENCVRLHHIPTGIRVSCQRERERNKNRFLALRLLVEKIEEKQEPGNSSRLIKIEKMRKQKKRRQRRTKQKEEEQQQPDPD